MRSFILIVVIGIVGMFLGSSFYEFIHDKEPIVETLKIQSESQYHTY